MQTFLAFLGHHFADETLLQTAITHSSWVNEQCGSMEKHNERLEFLGDAVLELTVTEQLFKRFPNAREGELTRMRSALVSTDSLAFLARETGLAALLRMGKGEELQGGRERNPLLADALEAVLGAIYLDGGLPAAQAVVKRLFATHWPQKVCVPAQKDFKTRLQERLQRSTGPDRGLPRYLPTGTTGPEHAPEFFAEVFLPSGRSFKGRGVSKRAAEQDAARTALAAFNE